MCRSISDSDADPHQKSETSDTGAGGEGKHAAGAEHQVAVGQAFEAVFGAGGAAVAVGIGIGFEGFGVSLIAVRHIFFFYAVRAAAGGQLGWPHRLHP